MTGHFNAQQVAQLLLPVAPSRVLKDAKDHSHLSQQDVAAHLIRVFGFGGFDTEVLDVQCVFERQTLSISKGKQAPDPTRYDVCYRALMRLTVRDPDGNAVCQYEDGSTATAQNQSLGDAHDLAYKSAISLAKKRCAINLGDQFGLSLYNKGQMAALVKGTIVHPGTEPAAEPKDLQEGVEKQVALGNDEIDPGPEVDGPDPEMANDFLAAIEMASTPAELNSVGQQMAASALPSQARASLRDKFTARMKELKVKAA